MGLCVAGGLYMLVLCVAGRVYMFGVCVACM